MGDIIQCFGVQCKEGASAARRYLEVPPFRPDVWAFCLYSVYRDDIWHFHQNFFIWPNERFNTFFIMRGEVEMRQTLLYIVWFANFFF